MAQMHRHEISPTIAHAPRNRTLRLTRHIVWLSLLASALMILTAAAATAQQQMPPAKVVTAPVRSGETAPTAQFVGTIYFNEMAAVATETSGLVTSYTFATGDHVRRGQVLVALDTDILAQELRAQEALLAQARHNLNLAKREDERLAKLFATGAVAEQEFDAKRFERMGLEQRVTSLEATVKQLALRIERARVTAPFDGVVLSRSVNRGEWLNQGQTVAEIGRDDVMDVVVDVPQHVLAHLPNDPSVHVEVAGRMLEPARFRLVPSGNVAMRTFPVRATIKNPGFLAQGMEARVNLPTGPSQKGLIVHRDAVLAVGGSPAVWVARDGVAAMVPVVVLGYSGFDAGIQANGLEEGEMVVVKGNERLRPGQPLVVENP